MARLLDNEAAMLNNNSLTKFPTVNPFFFPLQVELSDI